MVWNGARQLILPAALAVTTFAVAGAIMSCGGGSSPAPKKYTACKDLPNSYCQKCKDSQGDVICGPSTTNCYDANGGCVPGSSG
jgi:hypothetical protein